MDSKLFKCFLASSSSNLDPNEQVVTSGCHRQNNAQGKNENNF